MGDQRLATSYDLTFHETLMLIQNQEALQNKSRFAFCGQFEKVEKNKRKRKTWKGEN